MIQVNTHSIPEELKERRQWLLWKSEKRGDKNTKVPHQSNGALAKSNDPSTWTTFDEALAAYERGGFAGIGFVFSADDDFAGIDLDGRRHPDSGEIASWAREIIDKLDSYAEVSPSGTGVKILVKGKSPFSRGKQIPLPQFGGEGGRKAEIEIYDHGRFFTLTGQLV